MAFSFPRSISLSIWRREKDKRFLDTRILAVFSDLFFPKRLSSSVDTSGSLEASLVVRQFLVSLPTPGNTKTRTASDFAGVFAVLHQLARVFAVHADSLVDRQKGPGFSARTLNTATESGPGLSGSAGIDYIRIASDATVASLGRGAEVSADLPSQGIQPGGI